jgi:hypothetical protein
MEKEELPLVLLPSLLLLALLIWAIKRIERIIGEQILEIDLELPGNRAGRTIERGNAGTTPTNAAHLIPGHRRITTFAELGRRLPLGESGGLTIKQKGGAPKQ